MKPDILTIRLPFREQIDFFRKKLNLPTERWDDIWRAAHDRAFIVAGAMSADLLEDLRKAVDGAIASGDTIQTFRKNFNAIVARHGWAGWAGEGTPAGVAWRTRVIYNTNIATSYAAGRWRQLRDPDLLKVRPYWRYVHNDSVAHPRPQHKAWGDAGLTLRHDDAFWLTHYPPNGWGCRCRVKAVRAPGEGDTTEPPSGWNTRDAKGRYPGIDKGWDYAPGANAGTELRDLVDHKLLNLDALIGAAMAAALRQAVLAERMQAFAAFVDAALSGPPRGRAIVAGALKDTWVEAAGRAGISPATAEIMVRDQDVWHTFRSSKKAKLDQGWYKAMPAHLDAPRAVLLDTTHQDAPAFLLIFDQAEGGAKLVVRVDYQVKRLGKTNIIETGRLLNDRELSSVRGQIGHGYELIEGEL